VRVFELDYHADSSVRFGGLADRDWAIFLDSGGNRVAGGRFDIYSADPYLTLTTRGPVTEIVRRSGRTESDQDPLEILRDELGPVVASGRQLPFCGGAMGYFAYDLGRRYERLPELAERDIDMPEMAVGFYDWAVVVDHHLKRCTLVGQGKDDQTFDRWEELTRRFGEVPQKIHAPLQVLEQLTSNLGRGAYDVAFEKIKAHIRCGDCYQVNLAQRFSAPVVGSGWDAYRRLRAGNPAPYSAFINLPQGQILSSSPERFISVREGKVLTQPIKGTRPRGANAAEDEALARELKESRKDRAENVMIVDLLRNDLGKNCAPGSVRVTSLFDVESFSNVHHLVSTVEGNLASGRHAVDLLRGSFPGGSITGAPKLRAMQIIEECEPQRRSVYCGAIGYIGFDGAMDTSIAIRTLLLSGGSIHGWAGSGIVADSDADLEFQECLDKASGLLGVLAASSISAAG
jgi:para-aminobenzoate synthetase component 1